MKNLKLKKEAIDKLNLPIEVFEGNSAEIRNYCSSVGLLGHLGSLELRIPWANLKTHPVRVLIGDLYILAGPLSDSEVRPNMPLHIMIIIWCSMTRSWRKRRLNRLNKNYWKLRNYLKVQQQLKEEPPLVHQKMILS